MVSHGTIAAIATAQIGQPMKTARAITAHEIRAVSTKWRGGTWAKASMRRVGAVSIERLPLLRHRPVWCTHEDGGSLTTVVFASHWIYAGWARQRDQDAPTPLPFRPLLRGRLADVEDGDDRPRPLDTIPFRPGRR